MPRYENINVRRYGGLLRNLLGLRGEDVLKEGIAELQPTIDVNPLPWFRHEQLLAGSEGTGCFGRFLAAGGAGNTTRIGIFNPSYSGVIATLEAFYGRTGNGNQLLALGRFTDDGVGPAGYTQVAVDMPRDSRYQRAGGAIPLGPILELERNNAPMSAVEDIPAFLWGGPNSFQIQTLPFTIHPGNGLWIAGINELTGAFDTNGLLFASFAWRWRVPADDRERTGGF